MTKAHIVNVVLTRLFEAENWVKNSIENLNESFILI